MDVICTELNLSRNSLSLMLPRCRPSAAQHIPATPLLVGITPVFRRLYWLSAPHDCSGPTKRKAKKLVSDDMFHHPADKVVQRTGLYGPRVLLDVVFQGPFDDRFFKSRINVPRALEIRKFIVHTSY